LYRDDFIMASGRVARRKLDRLETGPYQCALLRCGVTTKVDMEDERIPVLQQAMEYVGAVGTMVMDELAYVHERGETGMGMAMNGIEREVTRVEDRVSEHKTLIEEVQGDVTNLIAGARMSANIEDALRIEVTGLPLGAEGVIPSRQIGGFLRDFKQFTHNIPSGKIVGFFKICPSI